MPPLNSILIPHSSLSDQETSFNILVKLNHELIQLLKKTIINDPRAMLPSKPKLVIKNGEYFLRLNNHDLIGCKKLNESARIDLYSNHQQHCLNKGTIDMRLNLLNNDRSRLKRIQQIERPRSELNTKILATSSSSSSSTPINSISNTIYNNNNNNNNNNKNSTRSLPTSPSLGLATMGMRSYGSTTNDKENKVVNNNDDNQKKNNNTTIEEEEDTNNYINEQLIVVKRLIHILSLGPRSLDEINEIVRVDNATINQFGSVYRDGDLSMKMIKYPYNNINNTKKQNVEKYVLRDEYYKDLSLSYFNETEVPLMLSIINTKMASEGYDDRNSTRLSVTHEFNLIMKDLEELRRGHELKLKKEEKETAAQQQQQQQQEYKLKKELSNEQVKNETITVKKQALPTSTSMTTSSHKKTGSVGATSTTAIGATVIKTNPISLNSLTNNNTKQQAKRKRTISESSNSSVNSVNSMKMGNGRDNNGIEEAEEESPATSQEEIDEEISLNEIKRQRKQPPKQQQLQQQQRTTTTTKLTSAQIELFRKFEKKYSTYRGMYQNLLNAKVKSRVEFQKFVQLENEIRILKRKLWKLEARR